MGQWCDCWYIFLPSWFGEGKMGKPARREREVEGSGHRFQIRGRRTKLGYPTPSGFQIGAQSQNACLASTGPKFQLQHRKRKQATLHTPINHKKLLMASVPRAVRNTFWQTICCPSDIWVSLAVLCSFLNPASLERAEVMCPGSELQRCPSLFTWPRSCYRRLIILSPLPALLSLSLGCMTSR